MKENGGSAFPVGSDLGPASNIVDGGYGGMTLRDYFAAAALPASQAMVADNADAVLLAPCKEFNVKRREQIAAHLAYRTADAMLAAREKGGQ